MVGALQDFLFAEGKRLAPAEGNQTFEDYGDFQEGTRAHALGIFLEPMLPIVVRIQLALLQESQHLSRVVRTNYGSQSDGFSVRLRNLHSQTARSNANHEVPFRSAVHNAITNLLNYAHPVIRSYQT